MKYDSMQTYLSDKDIHDCLALHFDTQDVSVGARDSHLAEGTVNGHYFAVYQPDHIAVAIVKDESGWHLLTDPIFWEFEYHFCDIRNNTTPAESLKDMIGCIESLNVWRPDEEALRFEVDSFLQTSYQKAIILEAKHYEKLMEIEASIGAIDYCNEKLSTSYRLEDMVVTEFVNSNGSITLEGEINNQVFCYAHGASKGLIIRAQGKRLTM